MMLNGMNVDDDLLHCMRDSKSEVWTEPWNVVG
jgi:hypothetical protein